MLLMLLFEISMVCKSACLSISLSHAPHFPLKKFLKTDDQEIIADYMTNMLCGTTFSPGSQCCSCEPKCTMYDNCCADYLWQKENGNFSSMDAYKDYLIKESERSSKNTVCSSLIARLIVTSYGAKSYKLIAKCPKGTNGKLQHNCESFIEKLDQSLIVVGNDGFAYMNAFCASCNGVKEYEFAQYKLECEIGTIDPGRCILGLTASKPVTMCETYINDCIPQTKEYQLCRSFLGPVEYYYNYFCSKCMIKELSSINVCYDWDWGFTNNFTLTSQLRAGDDAAHDICVTKSFHDIIMGFCKTIPCTHHFKPVDDKCFRFETHSDVMGLNVERFDACLRQNMEELILKEVGIRRKKNHSLYEYIGIGNISSLNINATDMLIVRLSTIQENLREGIFDRAHDIIRELDPDATIIITTFRSHYPTSNKLLFPMKNIFPGNRICIKPRILSEKLQLISSCQVTNVKSYEIWDWNFTYWVEIRRHSIARHIYTCTIFLPVCQHQVLSANSTVRYNNNLRHNENGFTSLHAYGSYVALQDGRFVVCKEVSAIPSWFSFILTIEKYALFIGSFVSCICYIIFVTSYHALREMRNTWTFCLFLKSVFLFLQDGVYFVMFFVQFAQSELLKYSCSIISVAIYFCFLSEEMWGVIMTASIMKYSRRSTVAGSLMISIVFTMLLVVLKELNVLDVINEEENLCRVQFSLALVIFYITPLVFSFICSVGYYIESFVKQNSIRIDEEMNSLSISALKINLVCSISEGLAFMKISGTASEERLVFNAVFLILYTLMKGFRGVIMLFILKIYVLMVYRKHKMNQKNNNSTASGKTIEESSVN